jgi:group II intron reverse transcriptase/maturase
MTPGNLDDAMAQKSGQLELPLEGRGEAPRARRSGQAPSARTGNERPGTGSLMEEALSRPNLMRALKRVRKNRGSPGIDGMTVDELPNWLRENWPRTREELLVGTYQPTPVRRATIPKPGGGERELGIPTVLDRLIQQALLQVLQPRFDPTFSEHSHGFRPGRSAHGAIREARRHVQSGKRWVVDVDLEKFFDRVNHDVLMGRLARRIGDRRVLRLIRRYLDTGVMVNGVVMERYEGTPQGGPLSPLLANVLLDETDKELEARGHAFVRYADDLRVFVASKRSGERVMGSLVRLFDKLRLRVNESKSAVDRAWNRPFLGVSFWVAPGREVRVRAAPETLRKMKRRVRQLTRRTRGRSLAEVVQTLRSYLLGWRGYFRIAETPRKFAELDEWIRHRLRAYQLKQWKRGKTVFRELAARGLSHHTAARVAANARRWWRNSGMAIHIALPNKLFDRLGLPRLTA